MAFEGFVDASVTAIEARDPTTSGHSRRVATLAVGLAERVDAALRVPCALEFHGGQDRVVVTRSNAHRLKGVFTVEAKFWLPTTGERGGVLVSKACPRESVGGTFRVWIESNGRVAFGIHRRDPFSWHTITSAASATACRPRPSRSG